MFAEAGNGALGSGLVEFDADAEQADDAACGDETRGVEAAGGDFGFDGDVASSDGIEDRPAAGISVSRVGGVEVRMLGEPRFAI